MTARRPELVVFARAPLPGRVKTRLEPVLGAAECACLQRSMVGDALDLARGAARQLGAVAAVSFSEPLAGDDPLAGELQGMETAVQQGADLGERLARTFQERLHRGAPGVVVIGSDSPTMGLDYLQAGFDALQGSEVVLGPAEDGGYALLGCARLHLRLFQGIPWGTDRVLAESRRRLKRDKIPHTLLRPVHDLDTPEDLVRTFRELRHLRDVGAPVAAPRTLAFLEELQHRKPDLLR